MAGFGTWMTRTAQDDRVGPAARRATRQPRRQVGGPLGELEILLQDGQEAGASGCGFSRLVQSRWRVRRGEWGTDPDAHSSMISIRRTELVLRHLLEFHLFAPRITTPRQQHRPPSPILRRISMFHDRLLIYRFFLCLTPSRSRHRPDPIRTPFFAPVAYTFLARPASPGGFGTGQPPFSPLEPPSFISRVSFFAGRFCVLVPACNSLRCKTSSRNLSTIIATRGGGKSRASRRTASENSLISRLLRICCSLRREATERSACTFANSSHGLVVAGSAEETASAALRRTVPLLLGAPAPHRPRPRAPTRCRDGVHPRMDEHPHPSRNASGVVE